MQPRFVATQVAPSAKLILEASCGARPWLRIGEEVQWHHMGEDGLVPVVVDTRGPTSIQQEILAVGSPKQKWWAEELLEEFFNVMDEAFLNDEGEATPTTVQEFVDACIEKSGDEIYELFYNLPDALRDEIYAEAERLGVVLEEMNEPCRAAMEALGNHYDVDSLRNY